MTFPPNGTLPTPPNVNGAAKGCSIWTDVFTAAQLVNPCWDVYQVRMGSYLFVLQVCC